MKTERELFLRYWIDNNLPYDGDDDDMKVAWTAWEASQQGEVDKLQTKIDELNERSSEEKRILHNVIEMNQAKIGELQARIDDASNKIDFWVGGKNGDAIHVAKSIGNILKGNKDEK